MFDANSLTEQDYLDINEYTKIHGRDAKFEELQNAVFSTKSAIKIYNFARSVNQANKYLAIELIKMYGERHYARAVIYDLKNMLKIEREQEKQKQKGLEEALDDAFNYLEKE